MSPNGDGSWKESILHIFGLYSSDGRAPAGGLVFDSRGNLYGTTPYGGVGTFSEGSVYQLVPQGDGKWLERIIASFSTSSTGILPESTLIADPEGNLFGTASGGGDSDGNLASGTVFEIPQPNVTAPPRFTPAPGTFYSVQSVRISDSTSGAAIYYTTDGSDPTADSTKYTGPIQVAKSETIRAIATAVGDKQSIIAEAGFKIESASAAPKFSVGSGTYASIQHVTLTSATPHAKFYYTTDGTKPTVSSTRYTAPILIEASLTLKAIAIAQDYGPSAVATANYTIHLPHAAKPILSPNGGTYTTVQLVKLTDQTPGAVFYYSFDEYTPTEYWTKYTSAGIGILQSETVYVFATAFGYSRSPAASAKFTLNLPSAEMPTLSPGRALIARSSLPRSSIRLPMRSFTIR